MARPKNDQIGEVECPQKGCAEKCAVFRFRPRGDGKARFAGKLYADCPVHGRYGADGKPAAQDYILENATIWGDAKKPVNAGPAPVPNTPLSASEAPALGKPAPVEVNPPPVKEPEPPKSRPWWADLTPIIK